MTRINLNDLREERVYVTPSVGVFNVICEGVLCFSLDRVDEDYDPDHIVGDI